MIGNIQLLRALAATAVVCYHLRVSIAGVLTEFYAVALFFMLSGYLMCKVSNRSAWQFAQDRFWRIVPAYWIATIILLAMSGTWRYRPVEHTLLSIAFLPHESVDKFFPVLGVGWTLNMEMYFYSIFTLAIAINQKLAPILAGLAIMGIKFGLPSITNDRAFIFYYTHDYVQFFCLGIVVWYVSERIKDVRIQIWTYCFPIAIAGYACSIVGFEVDALVAVTLLFTLAVVSANAGSDLKMSWIILLGNASYACYLLHPIIIYGFHELGIVANGTLPIAIGIIVASWVCAILWHRSVEVWICMLRNSVLCESLKMSSLRSLMQSILRGSYAR
ncbi:MAG: acyltransferase [Nitrospira sp.]|nr:acyltransferase [Nitrospira sp.]